MAERSETATGGAPEVPERLSPGVVVGERFVVLGLLGSGGMGAVYRAQDVLLGRQVALKVLRAEIEERRLARFRREVMAGRDPHPNLVRTFDAGEWRGRLYLAMGLVDGESLRARIVRCGALPSHEVERLADEILAGLAHLHGRGIVHRDISTGNILLTADGGVKLADFGLARGAADATVTRTAATLGTPAYMAPEQIRGERVGPPADLYALGVVLWEALSGERPFDDESFAAVMQKHLCETPDRRRLRDASPALRRLILRLLEKAPRHRFADAAEGREAWRRRRIRRRLRAPGVRIVGAGMIVAVVLAAATPWLALSARRVEVEAGLLRGVNRLGTTAWRREVGPVVDTMAVPATGGAAPGFLVLTQPAPRDSASQQLLLVSRRGRVVDRLAPADESSLLRDLGVPGTLTVHRLLPPADVDDDGNPELLAILVGSPWYMSVVVSVFDRPRSERGFIPLVFNPGYVEWARYTDADGDSIPEWYVAAMNNELLHTASVYRVDAPKVAWPPPRYGAEPALPILRWFTPLSREGGSTFQTVEVAAGGRVTARFQDGRSLTLDAWGNPPGTSGDLSPRETAQRRLDRYEALSRVHLLLLDGDVDGAERALSEVDDGLRAEDDRIAEGFRLLLAARIALRRGDYARADELAAASFAAAPIANDALMLSVAARILSGRPDAALPLLAPDADITMGSPSDAQEMRGVIAWLEGRDAEAWRLLDNRARLPDGISAQHRARILLGQGRVDDALALLSDRHGIRSHERLDLLEAVAFGLAARPPEARDAVERERGRHPWLHDELELLDAWLGVVEDGSDGARLRAAVDGVRGRARWDLYAHLDLPLLLAVAADGLGHLGEPAAASELLDRAEAVRPGMTLISRLRAEASRATHS